MAYLSEAKQEELEYYLPDDNVLVKLSDLFSMFSDPTRIKIITALCLNEMCVGDLSELLGINQTTVSHQLKLLRANDLVKPTRVGKMIYYRITNKCVSELMSQGVDFLVKN